MNHRCPTCGRRHRRPRRRAAPPPPLPLFLWAARQPSAPAPAPRLTLRDDLRGPDGEPRACLAVPGRRLPLAFPSVGAALAALRAMDAER